MKTYRSLTTILFSALILCFALTYKSGVQAFTMFPWTQDSQAVVPLEGLDPVMLVQGKEVIGSMKISVTRGPFQYVFATPENKALFEKNPERYEIQLEGTCARMGPQVNGNADLYTVYQERIYIFGSPTCKKLFEAAPEKYLESKAKSDIAATPEYYKKGQSLIEKAVAAMGGAAKLDGLTSSQEAGVAVSIQQQKETPYKIVTTKLFPASIRQEQARVFGNSNATIINVLSANEAFSVFQANARTNLQSLPAAARKDLARQFSLTPLEILRARKRADFKAAYAGSNKIGDTPVEQVTVLFDNLLVTLGLDPANGRILSLAFRGRNTSNGELGEITRLYSDFRAVDGLTLPFKTTGAFNGQPDPLLTYTVETLTLNGKLDPNLFEKPKTTGAQ
jgi:YHS domain-containing protein